MNDEARHQVHSKSQTARGNAQVPIAERPVLHVAMPRRGV